MKFIITSADAAETAVPVVQLGLISVSADVVLLISAMVNGSLPKLAVELKASLSTDRAAHRTAKAELA